jgi:hypothetical protein
LVNRQGLKATIDDPSFLEVIVHHAPFGGHGLDEGHALLVLGMNLIGLQIFGESKTVYSTTSVSGAEAKTSVLTTRVRSWG